MLLKRLERTMHREVELKAATWWPLLLLLPWLLTLTACSGTPEELRFHVLSYQGLNAPELRTIFKQKAGITVEQVQAKPGVSAMEALLSGQADLALVNNSTPFTSGVRAMLPVYQSVLHLLVRDDFDQTGELPTLRNRSIYVANKSLAGRNIVRLLAERQNLETGAFQLVDTLQPGITDLIVYFGPINPNNATWHSPGYHLVNLGPDMDADAWQSQSSVEYILPAMRAMTIPARTYAIAGNEDYVRTIGVMTLLVTRKEIPVQTIYQLTRTMLEEKPRFTAIAPSLFAAINESFDPLDLNFPLHDGARRYLERDAPDFLERYAETINMLAYLAVMVLTSFIAAARWRAQRKRVRIDTFYTRALQIRKRVTPENRGELLTELQDLEDEAFASLIHGKLAADESFRIFTDLLARTYIEIDRH